MNTAAPQGDSVTAPLSGIRVLDLTTTLSGPWCTHILGALGADVIKLERPGRGDEGRHAGSPEFGDDAAMFMASNANKRSLAIDLKSAVGTAIARRLALGSDVFIQNLRPGAAERIGLGFADLAPHHPRLVYCSLDAFGKRGPRQHEPGYDPLIQACAGIMSTTGEPGRPHVRTGPSIVDLGAGLWAAIGILGALVGRERTNSAQLVDTSLYEVAVNWQPAQVASYLATGKVPAPLGRAQTVIVPLEAFEALDGDVMIAAGTDRMFRALCAAIGLAEIGIDRRFSTNRDRITHHADLTAILGERIGRETVAHWVERLRAADVPVAPVQDIAQVVADDQFQALGLLQDIPSDRHENLRLIAPPLSMNGERLRLRTPPPALGEHSTEILSELGYGDADIRELCERGVIEAC